MRPITRWERFKRNFIWGEWSWRTFLVRRDRIVVGKLKVMLRGQGR